MKKLIILREGNQEVSGEPCYVYGQSPLTVLLGPGKREWTGSAVIGIITVWVSFKVQVLEELSKALHTHDALPSSKCTGHLCS